MSALDSQLITVQNETSVLTPQELQKTVWAVAYQIAYHYNRSSWTQASYAPAGRVELLAPGAKPPKGAWNAILLDNTTQAGALGYHDDETGTNVPYSEVFCETCVADGVSVSSCLSHEVLEMLCDPNVDNPRTVHDNTGQWVYIVEVADPVESTAYDVGSPEGRITGYTVSDWVMPTWFGMTNAHVATGYLGTGTNAFISHVQPFALARGGYISRAPINDPNNWGQIFGDQRSVTPPWASRLPRIHKAIGLKSESITEHRADAQSQSHVRRPRRGRPAARAAGRHGAGRSVIQCLATPRRETRSACRCAYCCASHTRGLQARHGPHRIHITSDRSATPQPCADQG